MKNKEIMFVIIIVSVIGFGITPLNKSVNTLKERNNVLLIKKQEKIAELKEFKTDKEEDSENIVDPEIAIPQDLLQTDLIVDLGKIGLQTGIQMPNSWSFSITKDADLEISEIGVSFPIKGNRGNIYKFLQLVEKNPRFFGIKSFGIRSFYEGNTKLSEMNINLYALSQERIED